MVMIRMVLKWLFIATKKRRRYNGYRFGWQLELFLLLDVPGRLEQRFQALGHVSRFPSSYTFLPPTKWKPNATAPCPLWPARRLSTPTDVIFPVLKIATNRRAPFTPLLAVQYRKKFIERDSTDVPKLIY